MLLASGAAINKTTNSGDYPFMLAITSGSPSLVSYLLDMGAQHDVVDKFGNWPMHLAMADGNRNIVMILIQKKFSLHSKNRQGLTPLLCAVINGHRFVLSSFVAELQLCTAANFNQPLLSALSSSFYAMSTSASLAPARYAANFLCILQLCCLQPPASR